MQRSMIRTLACAGATVAVPLTTPTLAAIEVVNGAFIIPTAFNGFEAIGPHAGVSATPPWNGPYTEGGITVQSIGGDKVVTTYLHDGLYSWYDGSGQNAYTRFRLAVGGPMNAFQFDATTQLIQPIGAFPPFYFQLLLQGTIVGTGSGGALCDTINICSNTYGFRGGLFDEVRLQTTSSTGSSIPICWAPTPCCSTISLRARFLNRQVGRLWWPVSVSRARRCAIVPTSRCASHERESGPGGAV